MRRLGIFTTHPVQYFSPVWRHLAAIPDIDLTVYYFNDEVVRAGRHDLTGVHVTWDVPLLDGYKFEFIQTDSDLGQRKKVLLENPAQFLKDHKFDAVLIQAYVYGFQRQVVQAAHKLGIRTLLYADLTDEVPFYGRSRVKAFLRDLYLKRFYRNIDAFCIVGSNARSHLLKRGIPESRMFDTPFSIDTELLERQRGTFHRDEERAKLGIMPDQYAILFSGRLTARKAPLLLIDAIRHANSRDNIVLIVIGGGELQGDIIKQGTEVLGDRLKFMGFVNQGELGRYFVAADAFVLPSEFDTWGLVVNEAMQFGLPVIASNKVGSHRDLIIEGQTGFVFKSGDRPALTEAIDALSEPTARRQMGENARQHIQRNTPANAANGIAAAVRG